jgi:uncharacterized membrane protein
MEFMEITCSRCHQTVQDGDCYCPACGLPQLVYATDSAPGQTTPENWNETARDASAIDWKQALRAALLMAVPSGMLCSVVSPIGILGFVLMSVAAAWAVVVYTRRQQSPWITLGAGARIGLVTGLLGGWSAAATSGVALFSMRYFFHQGNFFDDFWKGFVGQLMQQQAAMGVDAQTVGSIQQWLLSPEGRAGAILSVILFLVGGLIVFASAGGALSARLLVHPRRPEV